MIIGSDAVIMDYSDARTLYQIIREYVLSDKDGFKKLKENGCLDSFDKLQIAIREIEHRKFGEE